MPSLQALGFMPLMSISLAIGAKKKHHGCFLQCEIERDSHSTLLCSVSTESQGNFPSRGRFLSTACERAGARLNYDLHAFTNMFAQGIGIFDHSIQCLLSSSLHFGYLAETQPQNNESVMPCAIHICEAVVNLFPLRFNICGLGRIFNLGRSRKITLQRYSYLSAKFKSRYAQVTVKDVESGLF